MSTSNRSVRTRPSAVRRYSPTASRCGRRTGKFSAAVCSIANDVNAPSASTAKSARSVFTPAVRSHRSVQSSRSRPDAFSSGFSRSVSSVLPNAWSEKYSFSAVMKVSSPTNATSCRSVEAPLA
jgi:hypothetical protein